MNCREFETAFVLRLLEPLPPEIQAEVDGHRAVCRRCAARFEKAGRLPVFLPREGQPAPSEPAPSWPAVLARLEEGRIRRPSFFRSKIVWTVAGAAAVFLAGIAIGMGVLRPGRTAPGGAAMTPDSVLRAYVERLDPLLVDFQVKGKGSAPVEVVEFEKRMTTELLQDTALLKEAARLAGHSDLVDILDEIDVLLVSLSYLQSGDREAADQLRQIIRDNRQAWELRLLSFGNIL
ncbi:MAG: hypothetical protein OEW18_00935 [Candidatus Aminicenantes bacterium]|nr:hypothetical protein [Candidatus Aminicenantes bacterium]